MRQTTLEVGTLQDMLDRDQPVTVLDIRHTNEWAEWAIPGSVNVDAYDALKARKPNALAGVELPDDKPIVTI